MIVGSTTNCFLLPSTCPTEFSFFYWTMVNSMETDAKIHFGSGETSLFTRMEDLYQTCMLREQHLPYRDMISVVTTVMPQKTMIPLAIDA